MKSINIIIAVLFVLGLNSCQDKLKVYNKDLASNDGVTFIRREKSKIAGYEFRSTKKWLKNFNNDSEKLRVVLAINRVDEANITKLDSILVPKQLNLRIEEYMPFPLQVQVLKEVDKFLIFSYPTQTFAAYENGMLVYAGPTNMGRKSNPTPTGLFFTNWKAEKTTSTFNDEWDLKWNFNVENKLGVGFHEYQLSGYPASHSCMRLNEADAKYLFSWAEQWILEDEQTVRVKGTPVLIYGKYDFDGTKPWYTLIQNPQALEISEEALTRLIKPHLVEVLSEQKNRETMKLQS